MMHYKVQNIRLGAGALTPEDRKLLREIYGQWYTNIWRRGYPQSVNDAHTARRIREEVLGEKKG
jgi:hypothetical protein